MSETGGVWSDPGPQDPDDDGPNGAAAGMEAFFGIGLHLGEVASELRQSRAEEKAWRRTQLPVDAVLAGVGQVSESGVAIIDCGTPPEGKLWLLRRLYIGGITWLTEATGTSGLFVSAQIPNQVAMNLPAADQVDITEFMPNIAFYANRQIVVRALQHVYHVTAGATPGQLLMASGTAEQYDIAAYEMAYRI